MTRNSTVVATLALLALSSPLAAQDKPDLNGVWQALGSAHWDIEPHSARQGPVVSMGAVGAIPAGTGVIEGGEIPYLPTTLEKRNENRANWLELDPVVKCYMPGIPRATYQPFPFQIVQTETSILMIYEFASAVRVIYLDQPDRISPLPTWMGHSLGRWEGDTLVVEVTDQVADTWFDRSGNFHSEDLRVTERFTRVGPHHLRYEATIEDPQVFSRPWTISMPLYRRMDQGAQLLEFKCVEFVEEMMFGHLTKEGAKKEDSE